MVNDSVILFGGSFDPIHNGHLSLAWHALQKLKASKVIFIPSPSPRFKEPTASIEDRLAMLKRSLQGIPDFIVSTYEIEHDTGETRTVDTVRHFREGYSAREIYFLLGFDQVVQFHRWSEPDELGRLCRLIAVKRGKRPLNHPNITRYRIEILEGFADDCSSTLIRAGQSLEMPLAAIEYLVDRELYFVGKLKQFYRPRRFAHAVSVARTAYAICLANGLEPSKAYLAALYHDIAKKQSPAQLRTFLHQMHDPGADYPAAVLHQFAGALMVSKEFGVTDREILEAVRFHTTGSPQMGPYAMIVMAADKIEPTRNYDSSPLIGAMKEDYRRGFKTVLAANREYFLQHPEDYCHNTLSELTLNTNLTQEEP